MLALVSPARERQKLINKTIAGIEQTRGQLWPMIASLVAVRDCPRTKEIFEKSPRLTIELDVLGNMYNVLLYSGNMLAWHDNQLSQQDVIRYAAQVREFRASPTFQKYFEMLPEAREAKPIKIDVDGLELVDPW